MSVARSAARYAVMAARSTRGGLTATITGFTATASGASRLVSSQVFKLLRDQDAALLDCTVHHDGNGPFYGPHWPRRLLLLLYWSRLWQCGDHVDWP